MSQWEDGEMKLGNLFVDSEHLAAQILFEMKKRNLKLGTAESCTGGLLSSALTQISGSSAVFWGGAIVYSNELKVSLLKVCEQRLKDEGAVSEGVALDLVQGACQIFGVDAAISVTGVAGPSGGTELKPVGTVWFGFCGPGFKEAQLQYFQGSRFEIQSQAVIFALKHFLQLCTA
jgi:PncC family amidohydrolase